MLIMRVTVARHGCAILSAAILLLGSSTAHATVLVPGATVVPDLLAGPAGTLEDSAVGLPFDTGDVMGTLTAAVVRNAAGTLDFYYQITVALDSIDSLARNTNSAFALLAPSFVFATEVFFRTDTGGLGDFVDGDSGATPLTADRNLTGRTVGFNFLNLPVESGIDPGETSRILVIRTNAVDFTAGISSVIDGGVDSVDTFAPDLVPEPASLVLLGSAFAAAGYMARHRGAKGRKRARA
jgi:hypothetical protein